ncbi:uncharacterized protein LOC128224411 [Mya arenaria]|uniref:uncharacterized protein LOC128224411 n=1 Tax=Mya arenaria TaxID=6604 RepID=UPI0022E938C3|nr:uncharacterized protein LOC128224411 [Mya arenaria]
MDRDPEGQHVMSMRLSRVMKDIGVTKQGVATRRRKILTVEETSTYMLKKLFNIDCVTFIFGSQSEGTSTSGMKSDLDVFHCMMQVHVIVDWADWEPGEPRLLMIKNERSPPQHCCLQMVRDDCPLPVTTDMMPPSKEYEEIDGRVLVTNMISLDPYIRNIRKQGPSRSHFIGVDCVVAFYCQSVPKECQFLFTRPKPGHWPRHEILQEARQYGIFLVPQGHAESELSKLEWRFSTSLVERLLMFDLCIVKIRVYVFLKILRMSFFKPLVGDRLSTFHFKTALLFTVETYPPDIWQEHNLLQCAIYCLQTLQRWFKRRYCPHYTISGVDLFVGKLKKWELPLLSAFLSDVIDNIMIYVYQIEMDQIGDKMQSFIRSVHVSRVHVDAVTRFQKILLTAIPRFNRLHRACGVFQLIGKQRNGNSVEGAIVHSVKFTLQSLATTMASTCLRLPTLSNNLIYILTSGIDMCIEGSLDSDLTSGRLKLASMLYCTDQYERAELALAYTEGLLHDDVWQWCPCMRRAESLYTDRFLQRVHDLPGLEVIQSHVAVSVAFDSIESGCLPQFLEFEMYRTVGQEDKQHRHSELDDWMDHAIIDSIPFLYYLQYLTYRQLRKPERRVRALKKLHTYVFFESGGRGHIETALNVLGHCFELENMHIVAWACYARSLRLFPYNNAARWHIMRLLQQAAAQM